MSFEFILTAVGHQALKTGRDELNNISPWILNIHGLMLVHRHSGANLLCARSNRLLTQSLNIGRRDANVKEAAALVVFGKVGACVGGDFGLMELEELDADAIAGGQAGRGDLLEVRRVYLEDGGVGGSGAVDGGERPELVEA